MMNAEVLTNDVLLAQAGDSDAKARLLEAVEPLIGSWLKRVRWAGPWEDGMQEGRVGVLLALKRFDAGRGVKFSTFASWLIRQAIQAAMIQSPLPVEEIPESGTDCDVVVDAAACSEVMGAVRGLSKDEADLLQWRFYLDESLEEIGKRLGIHKFSASVKIEKVLAKVRGALAKR